MFLIIQGEPKLLSNISKGDKTRKIEKCLYNKPISKPLIKDALTLKNGLIKDLWFILNIFFYY